MATVRFSGLDFAVVALFGAAILALGFSAKLRDNSIFQFLAAGRSLTLAPFVATLVTVWYGGILGVGESVSYYGVGTWLLMGVPYYAFALVYAAFLAKRVRGAEQLSIPERLNLRWGRSVGLLGGVLIFFLAVPAAHVLMLGVLIESFTALDHTTAIILGALVGVAFLYKGGLLADVRVGMLAFVMMYIGFIVMVGYCLITHPPATVIPTLQDKSMLNWAGGKGWITVVGFFILGAWTLVDPGFHQRVASSASPEIGRKGVLISTGFWLLFDFLSIATGLYAVALAKNPPTGKPLQIYPSFANEILPEGLKAIFFCGMLGTILSAMVGYTLVSGTSFGREIVARIKPGMSDPQVTSWSRVGLFVACGVAIWLAKEVNSVVNLWYAWAGAVMGALLIPVIIAYAREKIGVGAGWVWASMAAAFALSFGWLIYGVQTNNPFLNVAVISDASGWHLKAEPEAETATAGRTDLPVGTLAPALVISALVIGIGTLASRRNSKHG